MQDYNNLPRVPYDPRKRWSPSTEEEISQAVFYAGFGGSLGEPLVDFLNRERAKMGHYPEKEEVSPPITKPNRFKEIGGRVAKTLLPNRKRK